MSRVFLNILNICIFNSITLGMCNLIPRFAYLTRFSTFKKKEKTPTNNNDSAVSVHIFAHIMELFTFIRAPTYQVFFLQNLCSSVQNNQFTKYVPAFTPLLVHRICLFEFWALYENILGRRLLVQVSKRPHTQQVSGLIQNRPRMIFFKQPQQRVPAHFCP